MSKTINNGITSEDLRRAFEGESSEPSPKKHKNDGKHIKKTPKQFSNKQFVIFLAAGGICAVIGSVCLLVALLAFQPEDDTVTFEDITITDTTEKRYSALTGEPLGEQESVNAPAYCIQTPNGLDGARPQAGLNNAGVIFEAIAEAGITRFAAIYQDPTSAIIGPIRSLRSYYLEWDTPFDCTIVHAGGASDALATVSNGRYKNLDENYNYMYRGTYGSRAWNNLFTTADALKRFSSDNGYNSSEIKGFARLTPDESIKQKTSGAAVEKLVITKATDKDTSEITAPVEHISLNLGGASSFNVDYTYDATTNKYLRSYASGTPHDVYNCPAENLGEKNPEDVCNLTEMAPAVVVAMIVQESRASDNYHEDIKTIGSGDVYIFQNGAAITGKWQKSSAEDQIKFTDAAGQEIKLAPGQTFITAIPQYGSVAY